MDAPCEIGDGGEDGDSVGRRRSLAGARAECGADVELFSIDRKVACEKCGFVVYNSVLSCIQWCRYAEQCFGAEMVSKYTKQSTKDPVQ